MQHKPSLFFQCQLYVAELSEPISLLEFTSEDVPNKFSSEQLSNSLNQISDHKPKISLQDDKINPYKSNWANTLLNKQFKVEVTCQGTKWIIKKVCEDEPQKSIVSSLPNLPKSIESQEKLLSKTNSKLKKIRFNKFFVDKHRQYALTPNGVLPYQNSSVPHLNTNKNDNKNHNHSYNNNRQQQQQQQQQYNQNSIKFRISKLNAYF